MSKTSPHVYLFRLIKYKNSDGVLCDGYVVDSFEQDNVIYLIVRDASNSSKITTLEVADVWLV